MRRRAAYPSRDRVPRPLAKVRSVPQLDGAHAPLPPKWKDVVPLKGGMSVDPFLLRIVFDYFLAYGVELLNGDRTRLV